MYIIQKLEGIEKRLQLQQLTASETTRPGRVMATEPNLKVILFAHKYFNSCMYRDFVNYVILRSNLSLLYPVLAVDLVVPWEKNFLIHHQVP